MTAFRERLLQLFENIRIYPADRPHIAQVSYTGRTDRKIIGSQNDLIYLTKCHLRESEMPASNDTLRTIEEEINDSPMSYLGMESPLEALRLRTDRLKTG